MVESTPFSHSGNNNLQLTLEEDICCQRTFSQFNLKVDFAESLR